MNNDRIMIKMTEAEQDLLDRLDEVDTVESTDYETVKTGADLEEYIQDIADTVRIGLDQSIAILTPWFFNNMPQIYYQTTPRAEKVRHLSAVITGHVFETKQTVELWNRDRSKVTYIGPGSDRAIIVDMASKLIPLDIKMGAVYFSRDKLLFLSTFLAKNFKPIDLDNKHNTSKIAKARKLIHSDFPNYSAEVEHYIANLDNDYVMYATAMRLRFTFRMLFHMLSHEGAHTILEPVKNSPTAKLTMGIKGVKISEVLENIFHLIHRYGFDLGRAFIVQFDKGYSEPINVMHFVLTHTSGESITSNQVPVIKLIKALRTLGWVDSDDYTKLSRMPFNLSYNAVNFLRSIASWVHILLGKENPYYYSEHKILKTFTSYQPLTEELVDLFRLKFDPMKAQLRENDGYKKKRDQLEKKVKEILDIVAARIFKESIKFTDNTLKTNYFLPTKTGLAFRLSPDVLDVKYYPERPFGMFFITGRDYRFFHVRWKDIARGGLRVVMPRSSVDHGFALSGLFDEVYGLSRAQQLKNKDIPEGGSKAVLVLKPEGNKNRAVRGSINALLDLLVSDDEAHEERNKLVSYYPHEEIIYLGPDENITNELISWAPEQAARRGYQYAKAFMSSKPGAGINHKEYGVTSEGLHVFVDHMLRFLGINPKKEPFTIKMTGGPDGDVAGNELKILHREYGSNARVVAIADGYGAAYDPDGLDWDELLKLVHEGKPISYFSKEKLSKHDNSFVIQADTSDNIRIRNNLHAVAVADILIPAGGRPYTVNEENFKKFLSDTGEPTCRAVVEGANIFFTDGARTKLQEHGILMIKDSSANKTGVICSSYEIIASLLLTDEEFTSIKPEYVQQVIEILRQKASAEAKLLFSEFVYHGGKPNLVTLSMEISREINAVTDILLEELNKRKDTILDDPMFRDLLLRHCPKVLTEKFADRVFKLPLAHIVAICASYIASYIVYKEGLGWLESIDEAERFRAVMTYMTHDRLAVKLVESVEKAQIANKESIISILKRSAARDLTMLDLEKRIE